MYITKKYKRKYHFKEISDGNGLIRKVIAITVRKESDLSEKKVKKVNCISDMYVFIYVLSEHGVAVVYFLLENMLFCVRKPGWFCNKLQQIYYLPFSRINLHTVSVPHLLFLHLLRLIYK